MSLSDKMLQERYGDLPLLEQVERMIEDMVDTPVIMERVRKFGSERFNVGYRQGESSGRSRALTRPGDGDMGG
jgi:hypothetical protein